MLQPALFGGLVNGVLSSLPGVNLGNLCCCLWVIAGGATAAYFLQQKRTMPINAGDGAAVGALAGVIGACVNVLISIPITLMMGPVLQGMFDQVASQGELPPEFQQFEQFFTAGATGLMFVLSFFLWLAVGLVFSTIGGLVGALIFRKSQPTIAVPGDSQGV